MARILQLGAFLLPLVSVRGQGLLELRNPYYGGYALPGSVDSGAVNGCPANTLTCGDPDNNDLQFCCPEFTFCGPTQLGGYCCPTSEDCGPLLSAGATCANPSWNLYVDAFIWCCTPDDVGLALGDGECLTTALTYSNYASTLVQANTAPPPSTWPGGTVPSGVSTLGGTTSATATAEQTTKQTTKTSTGTQATDTSTTSSSSSATSPTGKSSAGSSVEHSYPLVVGALVFAGSLLGAMWL